MYYNSLYILYSYLTPGFDDLLKLVHLHILGLVGLLTVEAVVLACDDRDHTNIQ